MSYEEMAWEDDYNQRDFQMLFQQTNAGDWEEAIDWLRASGSGQLAPGHAESMLLDLERLQEDDVHFVRDPIQAFELARQHRELDWDPER
jgi:hypothetical protein